MGTTAVANFVRTYLQLDAAVALDVRQVSGGDIHQSFVVVDAVSGTSLFAKLNDESSAPVLQSEHQALMGFSKFTQLNYPVPLTFLSNDEYACLLMEYHAIGSVDDSCARGLGSMLAAQHRITAPQFGWSIDNFIGLTPQQNN